MREVWARAARRVGTRPWTVNLYVLLGAALVFYVWVQAGWDNAWPLLFHLLVGASVWLQFAISAAALMLLVHGSTRAWFNRPIAERFP
jgi:hypothetical protein